MISMKLLLLLTSLLMTSCSNESSIEIESFVASNSNEKSEEISEALSEKVSDISSEEANFELLPLDSEHGNATKNQLFGLFYEIEERKKDENFTIEKDIILLKKLGVNYVRMGLRVPYYLYDETRINPAPCKDMHSVLGKILESNIDVHMDVTIFFTNGAALRSVPKRNISRRSEYISWLNKYYDTCYTLAKEFPEITNWACGNETNYSLLDMEGNDTYTYKERAEISTDMAYYGYQAIKKANPNSIIQIAGPVGLKNDLIVNWFKLVYENIQSGEFGYFYEKQAKEEADTNPDSYFDLAAWHPYVHNDDFSVEMFTSLNKRIYDTILEYEGKHKPVIFSEFGYTNEEMTEQQAASNLYDSYEIVKSLPFVQGATYYKFLDYGSDTYYLGRISRYGLFYDPIESRKYNDGFSEEIVQSGGIKKQALAYQLVANGEGELIVNEN